MKKTLIAMVAFFAISVLFMFSGCERDCQHERFEFETIEPTCNAEGYTLNKCLNCNFEYKTDIIPSTEHIFEPHSVPPTCTEYGYTLYICSCDYEYKSNFTAPLGHTTRKEVCTPTCDKQGYTLNKCISCDFESKSDFLPTKEHILTPYVTAPTCEDEGYTIYSCFCGYSYKSDFTIPTGHSFTSITIPPTSSRDGFTHHVCNCGYEYTGDYIMSDNIFHGAYVSNSEVLARGIDVSKWNGEINWSEIKAAGIDFVMIKAGSIVGKDPRFEENYIGAKAAGLGVGAYFYTYAKNLEEIDEEVNLFLEWLEGKQFDYPVYLDIEDTSQEALDKEILTEMCVSFIEKMQTEGYFCGIYSNANWIKNILETKTITDKFDLWFAYWTPNNEPDWDSSLGAKSGIWQYTCKGTIGTHDGNFDLNVAFKDYPTLIKKWGYNGY